MSAVASTGFADEATVKSTGKVNVVLVHGFWADGSSWDRVIPILLKAGHKVSATQLCYNSFEEDVAIATRLVDAQSGPTVLAGHSYGGAVISGAGSRSTKAKALVFVASWAPDQNEGLGEVCAHYPDPGVGKAIRPDSTGHLWVAQDQFRDAFCADVDPVRASVMAAVQRPANGALPATKFTDIPSWRKLTSWYVLSEKDRTVHPDAQRELANRMKATTVHLDSSHASLVSQPDKVAEVILQACAKSA
jgi:pimeloyl-ACP methyl ester carboxylesterase